MTSDANLTSASAATEQRNPVPLGITIPVGQPADPTSTCVSQLSTVPWEIDTQPGYGQGASTNDTAPANTPHQLPIPAEYTQASQQELETRSRTANAQLSDHLKILGPF